MRTITITVDKKGKIHVDFDGFKGSTCFKEREKLLRILRERYGIDVSVEYEEKKPEAYVEDKNVVSVEL